MCEHVGEIPLPEERFCAPLDLQEVKDGFVPSGIFFPTLNGELFRASDRYWFVRVEGFGEQHWRVENSEIDRRGGFCFQGLKACLVFLTGKRGGFLRVGNGFGTAYFLYFIFELETHADSSDSSHHIGSQIVQENLHRRQRFVIQKVGKLVDKVQDGPYNHCCDDCCLDNISSCSIIKALFEEIFPHHYALPKKTHSGYRTKAGFFFFAPPLQHIRQCVLR